MLIKLTSLGCFPSLFYARLWLETYINYIQDRHKGKAFIETRKSPKLWLYLSFVT